jgi:hypothetical protein
VKNTHWKWAGTLRRIRSEVFSKEAIDKWDCVCDSHRWYDLDFTVLIVIGLDPQAITDVCRRMGRAVGTLAMGSLNGTGLRT